MKSKASPAAALMAEKRRALAGKTEPAGRRLSGFEAELELGRLVTEPPAWAGARRDIVRRLKSGPGRLRLALTGGIASGKSTLAEIFVGLGARHIDFDRLARRAVEPGSAGLAQAAELFGPEILTAEGRLNRPRTAELIFADHGLKARLEQIIHPLVWDLLGRELEDLETEKAVLISVPLLFEAGLESFFSPVGLVFASPETQVRRLMARQAALGRREAENILAGQWPAPPKVMGSTFIINNDGSLEDSRRQVEAVWRALVP
ncbi:MAG: dephospho-CoA kinase [Candidatus Adiutrix sp.]|jgi:dephospho-CoA kinase|nr:dephospho-CoA kinase [Candidatus Adiutrix sp.]